MTHLNIASKGIVKGGFCDYSFSKEGLITYNVEVRIRVFLVINKTFSFKGTTQVEPSLLKSSSIKVGSIFPLGPLNIAVDSIVGSNANLSVAFPGYGTGVGMANLTGEMVEVTYLNVRGNLAGYHLQLEASL